MKKFLLMVLVGLALAGCGSAKQSGPTAVPGEPTVPPPVLTPGTGMVDGVVVDMENKPIEGVGIFVAKISVDNIISFSPEADERGMADAQGRFTIVNVPPGPYALAYWTPGLNGLIDDPKNPGKTIRVDVVDGQTISVGTIKIPRP